MGRKRTQRRVAERKRAKARRRKELAVGQRQTERDERMIFRPGQALQDMIPPAVRADGEENRARIQARAHARQERGGADAEPPAGYSVLEEQGMFLLSRNTRGEEERSAGLWDTYELAVDAAWEISEGRGPFSLSELMSHHREDEKPGREENDGINREAMLRQLRSMAEADPSIAAERKIHACRYSLGLLVLCRDEGCEAIADLRDDGPDTLTVDGVDVTPIVEGDPQLLQHRLTPIQIHTLAAVVEAVAELER